MNQSTLNKIIIGLLVLVIVLLVVLFFRKPRIQIAPTQSLQTTLQTTSLAPLGQQPVILESPYFYDSGYWLDPDWWWGGDSNTYVNNYYYDNNNNGKPKPTTAPTMSPTGAPTLAPSPSLPEPTMSLLPIPSIISEPTNEIQNILPTGQLIAPSQDSIFPLPTLAALSGSVPIPSMQPPAELLSGIDMPNNRLPTLVNNVQQQIIPDSKAAKMDVMASQILGMRGGNTHLDPAVPEITMTL